MAEKEFGQAERPSVQPASPAIKETEAKRPSFQSVLPKIWGENAVAFCDWCNANGKTSTVEGIVTDVLKK
jgi:hypothetical protein